MQIILLRYNVHVIYIYIYIYRERERERVCVCQAWAELDHFEDFKCTQSYGEGAKPGGGGAFRKLMDISRFDVHPYKIFFQSPKVYWHYVVNIRFFVFFPISSSSPWYINFQFNTDLRIGTSALGSIYMISVFFFNIEISVLQEII